MPLSRDRRGLGRSGPLDHTSRRYNPISADSRSKWKSVSPQIGLGNLGPDAEGEIYELNLSALCALGG